MNPSIKQRIEECSKKNNLGTTTFPESLRTLMELDVESYFADYRKGERIYYTKQGEAYTSALNVHNADIPLTFDVAALKAAILASQRDEIRYPEFEKCSIAAGCIGYFVWIDGKQVNYFGRRGELHIEKFPEKK